MKLIPPRLHLGPLSGSVYIITHGKIIEPATESKGELIEATVKYDVTDQFIALKNQIEAIDSKCLNYQKSIHHSYSNLDFALKLGKNVRSK